MDGETYEAVKRRKEFGGQTSFRRSNSLHIAASAFGRAEMPRSLKSSHIEEDEDSSGYMNERVRDVRENPIPVRRMAGN